MGLYQDLAERATRKLTLGHGASEYSRGPGLPRSAEPVWPFRAELAAHQHSQPGSGAAVTLDKTADHDQLVDTARRLHGGTAPRS